MITLDQFSGSCNALSPKICVPKKAKDVNVKVFDFIANKNEAKAMTKIFHAIANASSIVQLVIQIKNRVMKYVNVSVKILAHPKKIWLES